MWSRLRNKYSRRLLLLTFLALCCLASIYAQDRPKLIPPSPETGLLFKYADYPVDYYTGLPSINIPLYEIKSGKISLPISLSYHAAGRKVDGDNGPIALGWMLNAGGMITRTIYGCADEDTIYPMNIQSINNINQGSPAGYDYLAGIEHYSKEGGYAPFYDSEYDIFSISVNSISGKFVLKDSNHVKVARFISNKPYKISWTKSSDNRKITYFTLIDDKGISYGFVGAETSGYYGDFGYSSWYLDKMISQDKADTISFKYNSFTDSHVTVSETYWLEDQWFTSDGSLTECGESYPSPYYGSTENKNTDQYGVLRLSEIDFKQGRLVVNIDNNPSYLPVDQNMIKNLQLLDINGNLIRSFEFDRSEQDFLVESQKGGYRMDSLLIKDNTNLKQQKYSFDYYPTIYPGTATSINERYRDYWGYYNASGVYDMVPLWNNIQYINPNTSNSSTISVGFNDANREPSLSATESCILKKIHYPTGGTSEFVFELNQFQDPNTQQVRNGGGLRVSQIRSDDGSGNLIYKTYKYGTSESGYGLCNLAPKMDYMSNENDVDYITVNGFTPDCGLSYRKRYFNSDFNADISRLTDPSVVYPEVAEFIGTPSNNIGKTIYNYETNFPERLGYLVPNQSIYKYHIYVQNYWNANSLLRKLEYKNAPDKLGNPYSLQRKTENVYQETETEQLMSLRVRRNETFPQSGEVWYTSYPDKGGWPDRHGATWGAPLPVVTSYAMGNYTISLGTKNLSQTVETIYTDNYDSIKTTTNYSYNSYNLVVRTDKSASNNSLIVDSTKYPFDFTNDASLGAVSQQMVSSNMLDYPVEQLQFKNAVPVRSIKTAYASWGSGNTVIAPQLVQAKVGSNPYRVKLRYYNYDNASHPLNLSKERDVKYCYVWDYHNDLPVAEVINAGISDVAYTSFEADGTGGWNGISAGNVLAGPAVTGASYYNQTGFSISKSGLASTTSYIVSYWSKNGAYSVGGTQTGYPKQLASVTVGGQSWTYYEHLVSGVSSAAITGSGALDELRLYPSNAQMTTYTYNPLIGMTSQCDPNNRVSYFEYDVLGRLMLVRDKDQNVLRTYGYHYKSN